ncbi:hypothetical protein AAF712_009827 [Marasmius tenuissimus]|uniref:Vomeronasal type-1 receptor n=1 Tax=Marasmius tenuissimus TaxID=585030 RepID=A0ABR2ZNV2_9AGAR
MAVDVVSANLASVAVEGSLYGFFLLLSIISLVGTTKHAEPTMVPPQYRQNTVSSFLISAPRVLKRPIFTGGLLLMMVVTGVRKSQLQCTLNILTLEQHWIVVIIRAFDALIYAPDPKAYYNDNSSVTQIAKNTLLALSVVIGDSLVIYRMNDRSASFLTCNQSALSLVLTRHKPVVPLPLTHSEHPRQAHSSSTEGSLTGSSLIPFYRLAPICTVVVSKTCLTQVLPRKSLPRLVLIAWKIWHQMRQASNFTSVTGEPLVTALILFIESAALLALDQSRVLSGV